MDPHATLEAFDRAIMEHDRESVAIHADSLIGWLEKGGYHPCGPNGTDWRGNLTHKQLASMLRTVRAVAEMK